MKDSSIALINAIIEYMKICPYYYDRDDDPDYDNEDNE